MSSAYERLKEVITELGFTSEQTFSETVGLGCSFMSRMTNNITTKSLNKIREKFPQVNPLYIREGIGGMFTEVPVDSSKESIRARFFQYLRYKDITKAEFIRKTGLSIGFPSARTKSGYTTSTQIKVHSVYPDFNLTWLMYGVGNMLLDKSVDVEKLMSDGKDYRKRILLFCEKIGISKTRFLQECKIFKNTIMLLPAKPTEFILNKIATAYPQLNLDWLTYGEGNMFKDNVLVSESNVAMVPLVPQVAQAEYLGGYADSEYISKLPTIPIVKMDKDKYIAFEVSGDSMDDGSSRAYQDGDIVICKECPTEIIKCNGLNTKNKEFVIVHRLGILLKRIDNLDLNEGKITLHSFNPTYNDIILELEYIKQIWVVEYQQKKKK